MNTWKIELWFILGSVIRLTYTAPIEKTNGFSEIEDSLDDLLNGFRKQQMYLSNTMLNTSRSLQLPEKMAAAEVEEAEERKARAFRSKNEARTPFIATTSRFSLGYIGRGYDIYFGNPVSEDGVVDQGFRLPVIDLPFSFRFTSDGGYRIPDNVDVISEPSASFGSSYFQVKSESDYQSMLQADASKSGTSKCMLVFIYAHGTDADVYGFNISEGILNQAVNARAGGWGFSGSFSASFSYQKSKREIQKGETTSLNIVGRSVVYKARLSSTAKVSKVSDYFESAIKSLPMDHCEEPSTQELYLQVVREFGTHYTTEVVMGAKAVQELKFRNSDIDKLSSEGISARVAAELSYSGFGFSAGGGFSAGFASKEEQRQRVSNTNKEQREYYIGGSPPSGDIGAGEGSTESLREWARSASENPVPIQYKLSSIDSLFRPEYFKDITYGFYERRKCLRKALITHCMNSINPAFCNTRSDARRRLKRDTASDGKHIEAPTIRFGDFIKVRKSSKFLILSSHFGLITGTTVKILTSASSITNYDGLFQILPLEGQEEKMQSEVHYSEPFLLQTKEGEKLFMGRKFISNSDAPSEARLMDFFDDNNEERLVNKDQNEVEDFAVFLKRDDFPTYLVSLKIVARCYGSRISSKSKTYQVEIKGEEGTINAVVKATCRCQNGRSCSYKPWHHIIIVEKDIQRISTVQLIGMYGGATNPIKELHIKKVINGRKERITARNLYCTGRNYIIPSLTTPETATVEMDVYPVQFAFQSKQRQINQPITVWDIGFLQILSSYPKKKFWGQDVSHLLSMDAMGMISIKEEGPKAHQAISAQCFGLIYPSVGRLAKLHSDSDRILISFDVTVMVNYIEIETADASSLKFAYVNRWTDNTADMINSNLTEEASSNNLKTYKLTLNNPIYTIAVKIYHSTENGQNLTESIKLVRVGGCSSALIETGNTNTEEQEWYFDLSENEIKSYPFLRIVKSELNDSINVDEIFRSLENPVSDMLTITVPLRSDQADCSFDKEFIRNYLIVTTETSELKYDNIVLDNSTILSEAGAEKQIILKVRISVTGINKEEFDMGVLYLNSTVRTAISIYPCGSTAPRSEGQTGSQSAFDQNSTALITIAVCCIVLLIVLIAIIGCMVYRHRRKRQMLKAKQSNNDKEILNEAFEARGGSGDEFDDDQTPGMELYQNQEAIGSHRELDNDGRSGNGDRYVDPPKPRVKQRVTSPRLST